MRKAEADETQIEARRKRNAEYQAEHAALVAKVGELFRAASPRFNVPNEWWHGHIAHALMVVRDRAVVLRGSANSGGLSDGDPRAKARKYAGLFLRHVPLAEIALRTQVGVAETMAALATFNCQSTPTIPPENVRDARLALQRLQEAARTVEAIKADLNSKPPLRDREPIRFIAELAQWAWQFANAGKAPTVETDMEALSGFVFNALDAVGMMPVSRAAVRAVLRGDRRNK